MYKNNSRNNSKIRSCGPLKLSYNQIGMGLAIGYYSYAIPLSVTFKIVVRPIFTKSAETDI